MFETTPEAQAFQDGCVAHCDTAGCNSNAVMVVEFGQPETRARVAQCALHGVIRQNLPAPFTAEKVEVYR